MPTQQEIEYYRNKHQRMNKERFFAANVLALITHTVTQPFDLIKIRAQMLQEGRTFYGLGTQRGSNPFAIFREINKSGGSYKTWFTSYEGFLSRTLAYTTARVSCYLWFFDRLNKDPRRYARPDRQVMAGVAGGVVAGILTNPIEIVYSRMQVDDLYPKGYKRGYTSFYDGLMKTAQEGALFRGALANGLRIAGLISGAYALHDWTKENFYYFLGPIMLNRVLATLIASGVATALSMPFDTLRIRLYTQRQLPNGKWPYAGLTDWLTKIMQYEGNIKNHGNFQAFYAGYLSYFGRFFLIALVSQYLLDFYEAKSFVPEFWNPGSYMTTPNIAMNPYDPYTLAHHKKYVDNHSIEAPEEISAVNPTNNKLKFV